jgi:5'-nucleotidase
MRTTLLFIYFVFILGSHDCSIEWTSFGTKKKITFWGWYDHIKRKRGFEKRIQDLTSEIERLNEMGLYDDQPRKGSVEYLVMEDELKKSKAANQKRIDTAIDENKKRIEHALKAQADTVDAYTDKLNNSSEVIKLFVNDYHQRDLLIPKNIQDALAKIITGSTIGVKRKMYIDMDNVLVNFESGIAQLSFEDEVAYKFRYDEVPNIFSTMTPNEGAVDAFNILCDHFDVYILSTAAWENDTSWSDKLNWVKKYLGENAHKRLILSHHKELQIGDYLIDDRTANGAGEFKGTHIHFGQGEIENWFDVLDHFNLLEN